MNSDGCHICAFKHHNAASPTDLRWFSPWAKGQGVRHQNKGKREEVSSEETDSSEETERETNGHGGTEMQCKDERDKVAQQLPHSP